MFGFLISIPTGFPLVVEKPSVLVRLSKWKSTPPSALCTGLVRIEPFVDLFRFNLSPIIDCAVLFACRLFILFFLLFSTLSHY